MLTEENFIDFKCPHCGDVVSFPQDCVGEVQACPICEEDLIAPAEGGEVGLKLPFPMAMSTVTLRRFHVEDWKDLMEVFGEEELLATSNGHPMGEEDLVRWLESERTVKLTTPNQTFYLGIQCMEPQRLVGMVTLRFTDARRLQASVYVRVNPAFQRKGLATEALSSVLHFCFDTIHLHRVTASCDNQNIAAWRLFDTVGMRREGECVKDRMVNNEWVNTVFYALLREEYDRGEESD
jgi:RimJ/RimL family protein N-acetyltransferase/ribosomal protein S27E